MLPLHGKCYANLPRKCEVKIEAGAGVYWRILSIGLGRNILSGSRASGYCRSARHTNRGIVVGAGALYGHSQGMMLKRNRTSGEVGETILFQENISAQLRAFDPL